MYQLCIPLKPTDALLLVDVQNDFLSKGRLGVPEGEMIVPYLNVYINAFSSRQLPIFASRDWHPANHCSFREQGGPWPSHCVQNTVGSGFARGLALPYDTLIISKATEANQDAYSAFDGTSLATLLQQRGVKRLFIGGLATDYCVSATVLDALGLGFKVYLLQDGIRAIDAHPGDGKRAIDNMVAKGAVCLELKCVQNHVVVA